MVIDQGIFSSNKCFKITMQPDNNLVIYKESTGKPIWASKTEKSGATEARMQADGNFVLYDSSNSAKWETGTHGNPGSYLILQDDGNMVLYSKNGNGLWSSHTETTCQ
jgi:hypothetical protein